MDSKEWNEWIFSSLHTPESQILNPQTKFGQELLRVRIELLEKYVRGISVDMGCGIGEFTRIASRFAATVIGVDYSVQYINRAKEITPPKTGEIHYRLESINQTGIELSSVNCVFSYSTLYTIPEVEKAIKHFHDILIPGGVAILDFGNSRSLMDKFYRDSRNNFTAQTHNIPVKKIRAILRDLNFDVLEWKSFQVLPMQGLSKDYPHLWPLTTKAWQFLLTCKWKGKLLDELISSSVLRQFAFRHIVVVKK